MGCSPMESPSRTYVTWSRFTIHTHGHCPRMDVPSVPSHCASFQYSFASSAVRAYIAAFRYPSVSSLW